MMKSGGERRGQLLPGDPWEPVKALIYDIFIRLHLRWLSATEGAGDGSNYAAIIVNHGPVFHKRGARSDDRGQRGDAS